MTQPTPDPTGAELNQAIIDAGRKRAAAQRIRPRDQAAIDAAQAEVERLQAIKEAQATDATA